MSPRANLRGTFTKRPAPPVLVLVLGMVGWTGAARAEEAHLERVKGELIALHVQCTACHADTRGEGLTGYGQRLADMGDAEPLRDRVARMERRVSEVVLSVDPDAERDRVDIDGDGVLNWVELLCGTDPSSAASAPPMARAEAATPTLRERVENVVSCTLCHLGPAAELRKDDAPHNTFGQTLARLAEASTPPVPPGRGSPGRTPPSAGPGGAAPASAKPLDIWERIQKIRLHDSDHDKARDGDEIATFHHPADGNDVAAEAEIKALRERLAALRRGETGYGRHHDGPQG